MPTFYLFRDLTLADMEELQALADRPNECRRCLANKFAIGDLTENARNQILADFHFNNFTFAQDNHFSAEKMSTLLSLLKFIQHNAIEADMPMEQNFQQFKTLLLRHSVQRPPYSIGVFSESDVRSIADFVTNSFYRHYKLYMYAFNMKKQLSVTTTTSRVATISSFCSLTDSLEVNPKDITALEGFIEEPAIDIPIDPVPVQEAVAKPAPAAAKK
eukprot:GILK01002816.1.p1 GENE.GILK01002816.1~~GILK01002816.1.p1  ORF type:complete len:233 (+),score=36.85 GILK01002816.1:53-700(+)